MLPYATFVEAIDALPNRYPGKGFTFQSLDGEETFYSFRRLEEETRRRAAGLQGLGLAPGDRLGLIVIEPEEFVLTFLAAVRAGVVPVPLYPPLYLSSLDTYTRQTTSILAAAGVERVVTSERLHNLLWGIVDRLSGARVEVSLVGALQAVGGERVFEPPRLGPDDLVFLQYTSGSTREPLGVKISSRCLLANVEAFMGGGLEMDPESDVGVSWLPLYHDMGLVGFVLGPICWAVSVVFIPTLRFVKNASVWMDTVDRHRGTVTFGPNFAFALASRRARESELSRWDLSCLKAAGCGAEPIHADTLRSFRDLFSERCGLRPEAVLPAYGLAESTLAVTMKPLAERFGVRRIDPERFRAEGVAVSSEPEPEPEPEAGAAEEHVSCGVPLPGLEVAIHDETGRPVPDGCEGEIRVRGASVTPGYFGVDESPVLADGWLETGDLGYLHDGELYVTGRSKDLIILNGQNLHPQSIEWAVADIDGVRKGSIVAFSRPGADTEELVVVAESRRRDHRAIAEEIRTRIQDTFSIDPADLVVVPPGNLPKTSSGKLQRRKVGSLYRAGELAALHARGSGGWGFKLRLAGHFLRAFRARVWARVRRSHNQPSLGGSR